VSAPRGGGGDRLARLLNLVPYLLARPGIAVSEAAADLGVSDRQLREDLELLWVCGLPGYGPGDLIDMAFDGDRVTITYDAGIDRPLRLNQDEALALVVALRMLAQVPGVQNLDAVERALAKIESAAGDAAADLPVLASQTSAGMERVADLQGAVARRHAMRLTYYTATRDEITERVVDPMRVLVVGGRIYLEAWCRRAEAVRLFRLDRVLALEVLDVAAEVPDDAEPRDVDSGLFRPSDADVQVVLELTAAARWVAEYYPCDEVLDLGEGRLRISLRTPDTRWVGRLALRLGEDGRVISPPELASQVRDDAATALAQYA
jgi:proteasome accessory factor C